MNFAKYAAVNNKTHLQLLRIKTESLKHKNTEDMKIQLKQDSNQIQILNALKPAEYIVYNSIGGIVAKGQINENKNNN